MLPSSRSTESLLNAFPMFGHPGISALEYAGSLEASRNRRNTSVTFESLKRKSTVSTQDENTTPPTTAGLEPRIDPDLSPPIHFIDEFGCQQRRRGTFLNHTPRDFEMRSLKMVEEYRPHRASNENYSRPRVSYQAGPTATIQPSPTQQDFSPSTNPHTEKHLTINHGVPVELDVTELSCPSSPKVYNLSTTIQRRSASVPMARILTYQSPAATSTSHNSKEASVRSTSNPVCHPQEKKRQRRQTPFMIPTPKLTNTSRHTPLEPLVAERRRKVSYGTLEDLPYQVDLEEVEEMGTFGVIQRYFDSQTGGPVAPPLLCNACSQGAANFTLPTTLESPLQTPFKEPLTISPIELDPSNEPPAVPERSPNRLTNPPFPVHIKSTMSTSSDFAFAAEGQYSPYDDRTNVLHIPKDRASERVAVGQAARAGSSQVGRTAPPVLGHAALTTNSDLGLNDLSYYLKHTGPSTDPQPAIRGRKKGMKIFRVKQRKNLAARVGSVEGSPQRARKQTPVPACAREMTTSGGARHLKIIVPTETLSGNQAFSLPASQSRTQRRSRHVSITFTEEMLNPLASPEVERILSGLEATRRSLSEPALMPPRGPKRPPKSPKPVPVNDHPLASREEQTRARKLRDLQRIKRKPLPAHTQAEQHANGVAGALPTPAHTPEPTNNAASTAIHEDEGIAEDSVLEEDSPANKMTRLQSRVMLLQRQNTELTEALAKIVGLQLKEGGLRSEDVLRACREKRVSKTASREYG